MKTTNDIFNIQTKTIIENGKVVDDNIYIRLMSDGLYYNTLCIPKDKLRNLIDELLKFSELNGL